MKSVHFIGIGGIGMSALARYFKSKKWSVSGSDMTGSQITESLRKEAINVKIGHKKGNITPETSLVVVSQAIKSENLELQQARRYNIRTLTYPEAIGELTEQYKTIAIAGAHGKSTTTALAALTLIKAGLDPTVIVGVNLKEFHGKNFRRGHSSYLVLEADEFGRAFLYYSPFITIVTNIDREHLDIYKNLTGVKTAFLKLFERTSSGGALILNQDDKNLRSLKSKIDRIARKKGFRVIWYKTHSAEAVKIRRVIKIPGEHNLSNAAAVYKLGLLLEIPPRNIVSAIGSYQGAWRRMEYRGKFSSKLGSARSSTLVYDDYAHHPTEIRATLKAFKEKFPHSPLICVFQPHQTKRLEVLFKEFVSAFTDTDMLILIPSYKVAGRDHDHSLFTSAYLAAAIHKKYPSKKVHYVPSPKKIKGFLRKTLHQSSVLNPKPYPLNPILIMMGAGDIVNYTDALITE